MKKVIISIFIFLLLLTGCGGVKYEIQEFDYFYFDTPLNVKVYYTEKDDFDFNKMDSDLDSLFNELENTFSTGLNDSEISLLNKNDTIEASDNFITVLSKAIDYCEITDGVYDPSSGKLIELWSINNRNYLPTEEQINDALSTINCNNIKIDGNQVSIDDNLQVDLGSIAKGYASDLVNDYLGEQGVTSALINLGGNIETIGIKPDGTLFNIAIMKPEIDNITGQNAMSVPIDNKVVITSGINQRFFTGDNGEIYHHILNANTGYQPDNNLASVTIIGESGIDADALSTVCFLLGIEDGTELINSIDNTEAIFITRDKEVYMTDPNQEYELLDETYKIIEE